MLTGINGSPIYYDTSGRGPGLLVMHGGPGLDHSYLRPWLDALGDQVTLIYYDMHGSGRSGLPQDLSVVDHARWVADAEALRAHLGLDRLYLFGHSYGSFIAQEYALRHRDRLAGLILCSTASVIDYSDLIMSSHQGRGTAEQFQAAMQLFSGSYRDDDEFRRAWNTVIPLSFQTFSAPLWAEIDERMIYRGDIFRHANLKCLPAFNTLPRLHEVTVPALVLTGRHDITAPPEQGGARTHAALPHSEWVIFEKSAHYPFIEENEKFIATVRSWLSRMAAPGLT